MPKQVQVKAKVIGVKLTPDQHRAIAQRAERCGVRVSAWVRSVLLQAANRPAKHGHVRIREPDGAIS